MQAHRLVRTHIHTYKRQYIHTYVWITLAVHILISVSLYIILISPFTKVCSGREHLLVYTSKTSLLLHVRSFIVLCDIVTSFRKGEIQEPPPAFHPSKRSRAVFSIAVLSLQNYLYPLTSLRWWSSSSRVCFPAREAGFLSNCHWNRGNTLENLNSFHWRLVQVVEMRRRHV